MEMPLFFHWFAMEAYETKVEITDEVIKVHCNGNAKTIHSSSMDDLFIALHYILSIMNLENSYYNSVIKVKEITTTSQLSRAFDRFFFPSVIVKDNYILQCCHQLPTGVNTTKKSIYYPDAHIMAVDHIHGKVIHILVSDFKPLHLANARAETEVYAVSALHNRKHSGSFVMLGLPMTTTVVELWVYYGCGGKLLKTLIATINFSDSQEKKVQFFAKVYGIVHSLIDGQVGSLKMMDFSPKNLTVQCCDGKHTVLSSHCFYCEKKNSITKFYDMEVKPHLKPNVHLMEKLSAEIESKGRVELLSYPYKEGSFHPRTVVQIMTIIKSLHALHSKGYVHGDIRIENLIYSSNGKDVYIIDYDFARKEGEHYPECYNADVPGRHKAAKRNCIMDKFHDWYALHCCIVTQYGYFTKRQFSALRPLKQALGRNIPRILECLNTAC
jgi:hypothetical protein